MFCAVEASGDALGAVLMEALKAKHSNIEFFGCGGVLMEAAGLESHFPIDPFSVIGPVAALKAAPAAFKRARELGALAAARQADAAILIDGWSFMRLAAKEIIKQAPATKRIKYVAPSVWGSRPGRAKQAAALYDGILTLFEFEPPWFEKDGVEALFVGHSAFQTAASKSNGGAAFRAKHNLQDKKLLAVLPGSRMGEVRRLTEPFQKTIEILRGVVPDFQLVIPAAPAVEQAVHASADQWLGGALIVGADERYDVYAAADAALAASGTATTELAINKTPMVVGYRFHPITAAWVKRIVTIKYASMVNIMADREVIPEFLQDKCQPEAMAEALAPLLSDTAERRAQLEDFPAQLAKVGVGGAPAAGLAADAVLRWMGQER